MRSEQMKSFELYRSISFYFMFAYYLLLHLSILILVKYGNINFLICLALPLNNRLKNACIHCLKSCPITVY